MELVTLAEAATFLGVSKGTLRNWDQSGKLRSIRDPANGYRHYKIADLKAIQSQFSLFDEAPQSVRSESLSARDVRRVIARLHNVLRDCDSSSSLLERFDELSKLIYLALRAQSDERTASVVNDPEQKQYPSNMRKEYERAIRSSDLEAPEQFSTIRCSDQAILECGQILRSVDFTNSAVDVKGLAYEEVIKRTFDKTDNQQFFTPSQIVNFTVDLLGDISGDVCDPAAGTGGFIVEVARRTSDYKSLTILEIDQRLAWTAGLNALLHGAHSLNAHYLPAGGSLGAEGRKFESAFDLIITNPPFGSDFSDERELSTYTLGRGKNARRRGILFIERCTQMLRTGGRLAIIIDEGVLNLPHARDVRSYLMDHYHIDAIVSLPETAFMPYASVNAAVLLLTKRRGVKNHTVFFGKADKIGRKPNGDDDVSYGAEGSVALKSDLPAILNLWRRGPNDRSDDLELAYWAEISSGLSEHDDARLDFRFHHPSREISHKRLISSKAPLRSLIELTEEIKESMIPSKEMADTVIRYTGLAHIEPFTGKVVQEPTPTNSLKSAVKRYEPGDIVFAKMRPNLRKVALMDFEEGGYVSPECLVLRPRRGRDGQFMVEPILLASILRSDLVFGQLMHLIAGIGRPRLNATNVKQVKIPVPSSEIQRSLRRRFTDTIRTSDALREQAIRMRNEAQALEKSAVENAAGAMTEDAL